MTRGKWLNHVHYYYVWGGLQGFIDHDMFKKSVTFKGPDCVHDEFLPEYNQLKCQNKRGKR